MDRLFLAVAIAATCIKGLEIDHVRNDVSYRAALRPNDIAARASVHVESRDPKKVAAIVAAIRKTDAHADVKASDLRYMIRLCDARRASIAVVYLDAFGTRGLIDGQPVRFADDAIKRAITAAFPSLYE